MNLIHPRLAHRLYLVFGVVGALGVVTAFVAGLGDGNLLMAGVSAASIAILFGIAIAWRYSSPIVASTGVRKGGNAPSRATVPAVQGAGSGVESVRPPAVSGARTSVGPFIEWTDAFSVRVPAMDRHHKRLVDLINRIHVLMGSGVDGAAVGRGLDDLAKYAGFHFSAEERLMEKYACPGLGDQKAAHATFLGMLGELRGRIAAGERDAGLGVPELLRDWVVNHVQNEDRACMEAVCKALAARTGGAAKSSGARPRARPAALNGATAARQETLRRDCG